MTEPMTGYAVRTEHLAKSYGEIAAVADLDLKIPSGCIYGLIGPNGSGKTTTIKVLMGLVRPDGGSSWLLDRTVPVKGSDVRVSYMPQELALYTDLTVHENLQLFSDLFEVDREVFAVRERELLAMIGLSERRDSLVGHLSGGMQHRTSLACALINDPQLMFLDEPTVGVDPELRAGFWQHFRSLKDGGRTIVLTTHYMDEASHCDIVGMMHRGKLIGEGPPAVLMKESGKTSLEETFLERIRRQNP